MHAFAGAGTVKLIGADAASGAVGAVIGEMVGEAYRKAEETAEMDPEAFARLRHRGVHLAQMTAATLAMITGQDPAIAAMTAGNAARENALADYIKNVRIKDALTEFLEQTAADYDSLDEHLALHPDQDKVLELSWELFEAIKGFVWNNFIPDVATAPIAAQVEKVVAAAQNEIEAFSTSLGKTAQEKIKFKETAERLCESLVAVCALKVSASTVSRVSKENLTRYAKHSRVRKVNDRLPRNAEYAGEIYPLNKLPRELRQKYPHSVPFTGTGFPDFSRYAIKKVEIKVTGKNSDFLVADKAAGFIKRPDRYTWHHHHDGKSMFLVPQDIHEAVSHTGGRAVVKNMGGKL